MADSIHPSIEITDIDAPNSGALGSGTGQPVPPKQRLFFYSPDEWEQFILEWVYSLRASYVQVKRIGGSGDRGVDIAGFTTDAHFEGAWDCYQAKHYAEALTPATAHAEIFKMLAHVASGHYTLPQKYYFVAPRGAGPTLNRLLSNPSEMKMKFLAAIADGAVLIRDVPSATVRAVRQAAKNIDFAMFIATQLEELLAGHASTPYHAFRFGTPLPPRGPIDSPPAIIDTVEARYVDELLAIYREATGSPEMAVVDVQTDPNHAGHFQRQRRAFYSAEALRTYARDSVPPGTFDQLLDHMYGGVIEVADSHYLTGRDRLTAVLTQATNVQLDSHRLVEISGPEDRRGFCHQLANEERLKWVI